jgi:hypothetical protein
MAHNLAKIWLEIEIENDPDKLFDFEEGVYFLGEFTMEQRLNALQRAESELGQPKYYSAETCNCETFANWWRRRCIGGGNTGEALYNESLYNEFSL